MKKQIFVGLIALGATTGAFAQQGAVLIDNHFNYLYSPPATFASTNFGLIFTGTSNAPVPLNQDINLELFGGPNSGNLQQIAALTFANGGAQGDWSFLGWAGTFIDPAGHTYDVPGVPALGTAFLKLNAWLGNDATYAAALSDGSPVGSSGIYLSATGGDAYPDISIGDGMPSFLVATPEPSTLAFSGLGAVTLLFFRRKK